VIDLQLKIGIVFTIAWMATRKVTPANAAAAHRVWLAVLVSPILWLFGEWLFSPLVHARIRADLVPASVVSASGAWRSAAVWIYFGVAAVLMVRVATGVLGVQRLLRSAKALSAAECARLPLADTVRVREAALDVPVTAGFVRPAILLPATWRNLSPSALEAILRHEAAHVRRRDCAVGFVCTVIEALFWFNPFVWLAGRRLRLLAEMACDAEASVRMDGGVYAAELLKLSAGWRAATRPLYAITAGAETNVARRISLLLDDIEHGPRRRSALALVAILLVIGVPLAANVRLGGVGSTEPSGGPFGPLHRAVHSLQHHQ
jgi:beta-lactamase regulating signal transducer with metallopeptidase domain